MRSGPQLWTEAVIAKRIRQGLGSGQGRDYRPFIRVQDFSSRGVQTRVPSSVLGRTVHTHSYLERAFFLIKEFTGRLLSYEEQLPMDRSITLGAAKQLGVRHPVYPTTGVPVVMTLDVLLKERDPSGRPIVSAWDIKPHSELGKRRVLEKLSLHKAYCAHFGIPHYIFTERSVPKVAIRNIDWLRLSLQKAGEIESVPRLFTDHPVLMLDELAAGEFPRTSIRDYCLGYDHRRGLPRGTGLRVLKHLAWNRQVRINLLADPVETQPTPTPSEIVSLTTVASHADLAEGLE